MFNTTKSADDIRKYLESNKWELDSLYPGPEAFYPAKTKSPHIHFTHQDGSCYLHWKDAANKAHEVNSAWDNFGDCPALMKIELRGLILSLTMG